MDDDDSQEELINRNTSHNTGRRAELWAISDDSDDVEEESEEGESDSSEEQEEGHQEGGEEEEEGIEEEDDEEEGEKKAEAGAFGATSADLAGLSSDDERDKCPICLNGFSSQPVATPENCLHYFCLDCILEWTKNANSCPVDRIAFNSIYLRRCYGGKVKKMITVQKPAKEGQEERVDLELEQTNCEVCGSSDREDRLLLCDGCDAGYHMECLSPPLDAVPVEEWFCSECAANNRRSRASDAGLRDADSLTSTARPAQSHAAGPIRAIARTQQSERVRANVNRHRITQARTSQLAPTYLIQSTWLDETINAVVAGLNTAVYVRNFTPRASRGRKRRKRRKTRKRRKVKMQTSSKSGKKGKAARAGGRWSSDTLSRMRGTIGAPPLSIFGDPMELDPFLDDEEEQQQAHVSSLPTSRLSRSALRSHQPVARPVTASLSRRSLDVPQSEGAVEASPGPDLLGSILAAQSVLLMDSAHVIVNRDGSLTATKQAMAPELKPGLSRNSSSEDAGAQMNPAASPSQGPCYSRDPPGSFHQTFSQCPPRLPSHTPPSASHSQSFPNAGHPSLQPSRPISGTRGVGAPCPKPPIQPTLDHSSKSKAVSTSTKAPVKPTWVDVSVLPRIPKIRKDRNGNSAASSNGCGMPETGMNSLAGDKERKQSVDQQKGRSNGRAPNAGSSSSAFSNSFSSSSSSPANHPRYSSSSSASSAVSFRINTSGNSWHLKRANVTPMSTSGGSVQKPWKEKEDEAKKRRLHRDKQMLLASHTLASDGNNIYDPFNPTMSDSSDSDEESECRSPGSSSQHSTHDEKAPGAENKGLVQNKQDLVPVKVETREVDVSEDLVRVKAETQEVDISEEQQKTARCQEISSEEDYVKVKEESQVTESETVTQTLLDARTKKPPDLEDPEETKGIDDFKSLISEKLNTKPPVLLCLDRLKAERETLEEENVGSPNSTWLDSDSSASSSAPTKKQKSDSKPQLIDVDHKTKMSLASQEGCSSGPDTDRGRRGDQRDSGQEIRQREKTDQERRTRRSRERRKRSRSTSESSRSSSPDTTVRKGRRSRSKERRRSRSVSSSSSRERSRKKRHQRRSDESRDGRGRDSERRWMTNGKRLGRSRSKSRSRSRSRSKEHKRGRTVSKSRSRSRSRERRKGQTGTQQSSLPSGHKGKSSSKDKRRCRSRSSSRVSIKMETCEIPIVNSGPSFSEFPHSSLTAVITPDSLQDAASGSHLELLPLAEQPLVSELKVPMKQEPSDSDDDFNVDVMLDILDRVKLEHGESQSVKREDAVEEGRKEGSQVLTALGAKPKTQVKRVTWNIQEPEGPQPEKSVSKLALYKLRLKQEGARRPSATGQPSSQDAPGAVSGDSKGNAGLLSHLSRSDGARPDGDSSRKDTYLKKLHIQERAIEEVKLAIKPFYQRRDITKDEYKEIVRKAVQKVCHSKSGEINPVKVGNLVKAYVDIYKHGRKHKRADDTQAGPPTAPEGLQQPPTAPEGLRQPPTAPEGL